MEIEKKQTDSQNQNETDEDFFDDKISLDSDDFEALVDAFRTLLQWSNDLEDATEVK